MRFRSKKQETNSWEPVEFHPMGKKVYSSSLLDAFYGLILILAVVGLIAETIQYLSQ